MSDLDTSGSRWPSIALLVFALLVIGMVYIFVGVPWYGLRNGPADVVEEVLDTNSVELDFATLEWDCEGYAQEIEDVSPDEILAFEQRLTSMGFTEEFAGSFLRARSDDFDYDLVAIESDSGGSPTRILFSVWDTDGLICMPGFLARDLDLQQ